MFKVINYPDGQISVKVEEFSKHLYFRINNYQDLIVLISVAEVYNANNVELPTLFIPCLFGQRSDRRFNPKQSFDLKVICDIINSCEFPRITILDPHSDVSLALINNSQKMSSFDYVSETVDKIRKTSVDNNLILVSPDAGAYKKVFEYGQKLGLEVVAAVKHRDSKGNVNLHFTTPVVGKECLIVDDLCDGGYTFEVLGQALKQQMASSIYLYVSHGYFSKGFIKLHDIIDHIYCTNSVKDIENYTVGEPRTSQDMYPDKYETFETKDFITQFKVI